MRESMPPAPDENTTPPRKTISRRLRYEILRRDNNTCRYCRATDAPLTIDHVTPVALGGTDDPANLVAACKDCNAGKSSSSPGAPLVAQVAEDAVRWATAMQAAAERMAANKAAVSDQLQPWFDEWFTSSGPGWSYKLPADADAVLTKYLAAGMPLAVLMDAARVALRKQGVDGRFRYFQGVANNMLAELQRDAATLMSSASDGPAESGQTNSDDSLGWGNRAWRKGYLTALKHMKRAESGDDLYREAAPVSAFQYGALAMVVDAPAMDWVASA